MHAENIVTEMHRASLQQKTIVPKHKRPDTQRGVGAVALQEIKQIQQLITKNHDNLC